MYSLPRLKSTRYVDTVVGVSKFSLEHHKKYSAFSQTKQVVIYNGISLMERHALQGKSLADGERCLRFGFLGKIDEVKGIEVLIDAFLQLESNQAELWIAGRGLVDYEEKLKQLTNHRGDIQWLGYVNPGRVVSKY